jgi:hypothetical protein
MLTRGEARTSWPDPQQATERFEVAVAEALGLSPDSGILIDMEARLTASTPSASSCV